MPPIPTPAKGKAAPSAGRSGGTGGRTVPEPGPSPSSSGTVRRNPGGRKLEEKVARMYMVLGTALLPMKRFLPQLEPISVGMRDFSKEAAEAWADLAEEDPKVRKALESITGASSWGNIIAIHFSIFAGAIVPQQMFHAMAPVDESDPYAIAKAMGLSDEEAAAVVRMAEGITSDRPPEPPVQEVRKTETRLPSGTAIVSPEQLGVIRDGQENSTPIPNDATGPAGR